MPDTVELWRARRPGRGGVFQRYSVQGIQYESTNGELAWHITVWSDRDPVSDYWVARRKLFAMAIHYWSTPRGDSRIEIFGERDVSAEQRRAVFDAIAEWERPAK